MRRASESTSELKGKETWSFDGKLYFDLLADFLRTKEHLPLGEIEKMPDPGPLTHMVMSTKGNRGVAYGKPEKLKLVNITASYYHYFVIIRICLFHPDDLFSCPISTPRVNLMLVGSINLRKTFVSSIIQ